MIADALRVVSSQVSWGSFASDGSLGYDGGCCVSPLCRADLRGHRLLSAHAPSKVIIECAEPVDVLGFLNASARFDPRNPVEFWADWNFVGEVSVPAAATAPMRLTPGRHELVTVCVHPETRHTLWALRRAEARPAAELTAITIAAYPEAEVPVKLRILARSARKQGVDLRVCFVSERYATHAEMKIRRLRPVIELLSSPRVVYIDGRDSVFLSGLEHIDREFQAMRAPIVMSAEAGCHPLRDADWAARFPSHPTGCNWLNAGQWMGDRGALLHALRALEELQESTSGRYAARADFGRHGRLRNDDQFLWQLGWVNGLVPLVPDYEGRIFRNVNTLDTTLGDNQHFDLSDGLVFKPSGRRPGVLHFTGDTAETCMAQWAGFLGAY